MWLRKASVFISTAACCRPRNYMWPLLMTGSTRALKYELRIAFLSFPYSKIWLQKSIQPPQDRYNSGKRLLHVMIEVPYTGWRTETRCWKYSSVVSLGICGINIPCSITLSNQWLRFPNKIRPLASRWVWWFAPFAKIKTFFMGSCCP